MGELARKESESLKVQTNLRVIKNDKLENKVIKHHEIKVDNSSLPVAKISSRFFAVLLDGIAYGIINNISIGVFVIAIKSSNILQGDELSLAIGIGSVVIQLSTIFFYFCVPLVNKGQTIGKKVLKIKVCQNNDSNKLTYGNVFKREFIGKFLSGILFFGGYIMAIARKDNRSLHDLIGNTKVVDVS
jgi:uncharacterized RDD family membrane protein YckC